MLLKHDYNGLKRGNSFKDRTGETNINNQGLKMTIREYRSATDIDVEFENGTVVNNVEYKSFIMGCTRNTNRVGIANTNKYGHKMTILEDNGSSLKIKFNNGHIASTSFKAFMSGDVFNPMDKRVLGIGYLGFGKYIQTIDGVQTDAYKTWYQMIRRCYDIKSIHKNETYADCKVCEEWHNFQNFAKWYEDNYYIVGGENQQLDKDILVKGNKTYSPDTCVFAPHRINSLFVKSNKMRGGYPIGVQMRGDRILGKDAILNRDLRFDSIEQAFNHYKKTKETAIKQVADEYKDKIPNKLYEAMYRYRVETTD